MKYKIEKIINRALAFTGLKLISQKSSTKDMDSEFEELYSLCKNHTKTSKERMFALYKSVKYIIDSGIKGDFVECGVWKGGSSMLVALVLKRLGEENRKIWLYDTFEGMSKPTKKDVKIHGGKSAIEMYRERKGDWDIASLEEVRRNMLSTKFPKSNILFIKGKVEDTIPGKIPKKISLLRLDTDFYESTYHELKHLFPLLEKKGVFITDDYGHWKGARDAVDKYFNEKNINLLLNRVDKPCRIGVK